MENLFKFLLILVILFICFSCLSARTWYVKPDGTGDASTIQAGIDSAAVGDTVLLANGTFTGDGNRDIDYFGKAITLVSESGNPGSCIINCEGSSLDPHRGLYFKSGEDSGSVLDGVTITNGLILWDAAGGGILCESNSSPSISHCIFKRNSDGNGSGIACVSNSSPSISYCIFERNFGEDGGALFCEGSCMTITDCVFNGNSSLVASGAVNCCNSDVSFIGCIFSNNTNGGLSCSNGSVISDNCQFISNHISAGFSCLNGSVIITNSKFSNNWGAINCNNSNVTVMNSEFTSNYENETIRLISSNFSVTRCTFSTNLAGYGGAIYLNAATGNILGCDFYRNHAAYGGGGILCHKADVSVDSCSFHNNGAIHTGGGALYIFDSQPKIANCNFIDNWARAGGAIYCHSSESKFTNCIISRNRTDGYNGGGICIDASNDTLISCAFIRNRLCPEGDGSGAYCINNSNPIFINCTFYANGQAVKAVAAIHIDNSFVSIDKSIISYTQQGGHAISCSNGGWATLSCCDVFGNSGGDYVGCIIGQNGINGNFSADPLFCDSDNDILTLDAYSPCLAENNQDCGLIGAFGVGCGDGYTPPGTNIVVQPVDTATGADPVTITFDSVTVAGVTRLVISSHGPPPPNGFKVCSNTYYDITTTATYVGTIVVCIDYSTSDCTGKVELKRFVDGVWVPCEPSYEPSPNVICAEVSSLSTFAVFVPAGITFDIKPRSCPNPFNIEWLKNIDKNKGGDHAIPKKGGVLPAALVGSVDFDVTEVDVSTLRLQGIEPLRTAYEDVTTPVSNGGECACTTAGPDGILDLTMKFSRLEVAELLRYYERGDEVELTLAGSLLDGTQFEASDCVIIVGKEPEPSIDTGSTIVTLGPVSPNPFNPWTMIGYYLPFDCSVTIEIYDSAGRRIASLLDGEQRSKGAHTVEWSGIDDHGRSVASGMYFCRLIAGKEAISRKMILLR